MPEWPAELQFMPAHEQAQFKKEVAQVRQQHPEGSPMMLDERKRLERAYCVDPEVLEDVFAYVAHTVAAAAAAAASAK